MASDRAAEAATSAFAGAVNGARPPRPQPKAGRRHLPLVVLLPQHLCGRPGLLRRQTGPPAMDTTRRYETLAIASSASCTAASLTTSATTNRQLGGIAQRTSSRKPLDISNMGCLGRSSRRASRALVSGMSVAVVVTVATTAAVGRLGCQGAAAQAARFGAPHQATLPVVTIGLSAMPAGAPARPVRSSTGAKGGRGVDLNRLPTRPSRATRNS